MIWIAFGTRACRLRMTPTFQRIEASVQNSSLFFYLITSTQRAHTHPRTYITVCLTLAKHCQKGDRPKDNEIKR